MSPPYLANTDPEAALRVLAALIGARKAIRFYPPSNPLVRQAIDRLRACLDQPVDGSDALVLEVERDCFPAVASHHGSLEGDLRRLAFKLHCLEVRELELRAGFSDDETVSLLQVLNQPYEELRALGPLDQTLRGCGIEHAVVRYSASVVPTRGETDEAAPGTPPASGPAAAAPQPGPPATGAAPTATTAAVQAAAVAAPPALLPAGQPPAGSASPPPVAVPPEPLLRRPRELLNLLRDPSQLAREMVRRCVEVVPGPGEKRLEAQLAFVERFLQATSQLIEREAAAERPALYQNLATALGALTRGADVSGARMGGLPRVDLARIDPKVLEILPERDLVKELSSKVRLHQGATTVMASSLREVLKTVTGEASVNPILKVIEASQDSAQSVVSNIQVIDEIRVGSEVDGEYPGIVYAERDRNKNFSLATNRFAADFTHDDRRETSRIEDALEEWRPEVDVVETELDMLANELNPTFFATIVERLLEKLGEFLERGDLEPALTILRGFNVERRKRRTDPATLATLEEALRRVEDRSQIERLLGLAETVPLESPAFESVKSFLFLLDKRVVHALVELIADESGRYTRRRILELVRFLCRTRVDLLGEGLRSPRPEVVRTYVWLAGQFGDASLPWLRRAAHHPEPRVRREVVRALAGVSGAESTRVVGALLGDRDDGVATAALRALVARGASEAAPLVDEILAEERFLERPEEVAVAFLRAAGKLGSDPTLRVLHRLEDRGGFRLKLRGTALRESIRAAIRDIDDRLREQRPAEEAP